MCTKVKNNLKKIFYQQKTYLCLCIKVYETKSKHFSKKYHKFNNILQKYSSDYYSTDIS